MKIVADTNIFLAVVLEEPEKEKIIHLTKGADIVAPEVLPFEMGNALTAMLKKHRLNVDEVTSAWDALQAISVALYRIDIRSTLEIATHSNIYAYDAYFIECASSLKSPLLTLDRRMKEVAQKNGVPILE